MMELAAHRPSQGHPGAPTTITTGMPPQEQFQQVTTQVPSQQPFFDVLDRNHDGVVTRDEFESVLGPGVANVVTQSAPVQSGPTILEQALGSKVSELDEIIIQKDQLIKDLQSKLKAAHAAKAVMGLVDKVSHNGRITKSGMQSHLVGTPYEDFLHWILTSKQWNQHDADGSGTLEKVELVHAFEAFYGHPLQRDAQNKAPGSPRSPRSPKSPGPLTTGRVGKSFDNFGMQQPKPARKYKATDRKDVVDVRLEEFYNATSSQVPFRKVNKGFYRFGDTTLELKIVNQKLMAQTEDGWNRGKFGPIEKFMVCYETIEREKSGIPLDDNSA